MNIDFTADAFFCHQQLIMSLIDSSSLRILKCGMKAATDFDGPLKKAYINRLFVDALFSYLKNAKVPSIQEAIATQCITLGMPVWIEEYLYFKDVTKALKSLDKGTKPSYFGFHCQHVGTGNIKLYGSLNAEHLFSSSASVALAGRQRKFIVATVKSIEFDQIELRPVFVGDRLIVDRQFPPFQLDDLEVDVARIDEFSQISKIKKNDPLLDLNDNKQIKEEKIKQYFAEIIGERYVPKDWGGESSDLFTQALHISGRKVKAAFLFKGPSCFQPLKVTHLGKNGDQVGRLFDEPADLFVIQHCHFISPPVVKHIVAYASRFDRVSRYCLIDGIDTQRILRAYSKL